MKRLLEIEPEERVVVKRLEGPPETLEHLSHLGITEGAELYVEERIPQFHEGPVSLEVEGKTEILSEGWAERVELEQGDRTTSLLELEGGKGVVKKIKGGREFKDSLGELGIEEGSEVRIIEHAPINNILVKVYGRIIKINPNLASKLLVDDEGELIQLNRLDLGKTAKLAKVLGGKTPHRHIPGIDLNPGLRFTMKGWEAETPARQGGYFIKAKVRNRMINRVVTIGHIEAEKILVE